MGYKYKTKEEAKAAQKAYQIAYRALRKSGQWVPKSQRKQGDIVALFEGADSPDAERREQRRQARLAYAEHLRAHAAELAEKRARREALKKMSPEEREAAIRERNRQKEAEYRERHRVRIAAYNRAYRRRKRDEEATPEELAKRLERRAAIRAGTPVGIIESAIRAYADAHGLSPDEVTSRAVANGAIEAMMRSLEPDNSRAVRLSIARTVAPDAFAFFMDSDAATLTWTRQPRHPSIR